MRAVKAKKIRQEAPLKLDFGCGPSKRAGFLGVDGRAFPGVDQVVDLVQRKRGVTYAETIGPAEGDLARVYEPWFYYLDKTWRAANAPHNDAYRCHFAAGWGYSLRTDITARNQEYQQMAIQNYKEVCQDIIATLTKA